MPVDWSRYVVKNVDWREHYVKKGDPTAPTYYIIRRKAGVGVGLFSNYAVFASQIKYALIQGYIPVIDLQNYPNQCLAPELLGKENAWEYYFEQPLRIGLERAYNGENVLVNSGEPAADAPGTPSDLQFYKNKDGTLSEWRMLVKLGLLKIKPQLQKKIDDTYSKFFSPADRVLGVKLRGTDYYQTNETLAPIPPPWNLRSHTSSRNFKSGTATKFSWRLKMKNFR